MCNASTPAPDADLDAETEPLGGSDDDSPVSGSSDPIPDNFMGVVDVPEYYPMSSSDDLYLDNWKWFSSGLFYEINVFVAKDFRLNIP